MKINSELIKKIFDNKIKLKKKDDKIKLSKFEEIIPMYDIYSQKIYPIKNINLHYRLIDSHYRFINSEIKKWIENKMSKEKNEDLKKILKNNLEIINNYNLDILEITSYKTYYKYSPNLGLSVSICKRNSFHPYNENLKPYYSRMELIKLGQNMDIMKKFDPKRIIDKDLHYKICKKISNNDISRKEIRRFNKYLINQKCLNWICFYSFTGSYLMNDFLRNRKITNDKVLFDGINKISNVIKNAPSLEKDCYFYRFVSDDSFLSDIKIGQTFVDEGFLSTTRDPFYSPGIDQKFGLILLKINVPKNLNGVGIFIENFSLFQKEEEFIISPFTKLKLLSKDDKFKYYHTNSLFEETIKKKYEFEVKSIKYNNIKDYKFTKESLTRISINDSYIGEEKLKIIKNFISSISNNELSDNFKIVIKDKDYIFNYQWFDSSDTYSKFHYNKMEDGIIFNYYEDGYPTLSIELGEEMVVNYLNKFYLYDSKKRIEDDILVKIVAIFGKIFKYKKIKIYTEYRKFSELDMYKSIELNDIEYSDLLHTKLFNNFLYQYCKNNKYKEFDNKFIEYNYSYWKLDKFLNKKIDKKLTNKLPDNLKNVTYRNLIIEIIEKHFYLYSRLESWINKFGEKIIDENYYIFDTEFYLNENKIDYYFPMDIKYNLDKELSKNFKLIFRNNIRRII